MQSVGERRGEEDAWMLSSPFEDHTKWSKLGAAQRMPTEGSESDESKDKIDFDYGDKDATLPSLQCSQRQMVCTSQRVRLNTSLHSPFPSCLDGDASSNGNLSPPRDPAERDSSHQHPHSRARSDRSNMRFEWVGKAVRVHESHRREYNRRLGEIGLQF